MDVIDFGKYGTVFERNGRAVKVIEKCNMMEHHAVKTISHPNLCSVSNIKLEYKDGWRLEFEMPIYSTPVKYDFGFFLGIAKGLSELHNNDILHLDLRLANFMLDSDTPILIDYGMSLKNNTYAPPDRLQLMYRAPELGRKGFTKASDVWMLGVTMLFALVPQLVPQGFGTNPKITRDYWLNLDRSQFPFVIAEMLCPDPELRPTIDQVVEMISTHHL